MLIEQSARELPPGLEDMPPGPELAAALASIDRSALCGYDVVVVLAARARQVAHEQAELYADMVAVAERVKTETSDRSSVWDSDIPQLAAAEIAAALTLTKRAAKTRLDEAWFLIRRLPAVWQTFRDGRIDVAKARVFTDGTAVLADEAAREVAAALLPQAPGWTTGQLAYQVRKLVAEIDPGTAKKVYERGVAQRRVVTGANADGTGYLFGAGLPAEQSAAAFERIDAFARAAKHCGDSRPMDQIRTDIYLGLLTGTHTGPGPIHRQGVLELTCDLPTLLGLAEHAGDLDGYGPVIADIARRVTRQMATDPDSIWRYSITDPITGRLLFHGTTPARPTRASKDPRRVLTPRDRAFVVARDRTCRGPGCRAPARRSEIDHIVDHAHGGRSTPRNTDTKCRYCHTLKHSGWKTERDTFGQTHWTTPLGHNYTVPPQPITQPQRLTPAEHRIFATTRMRT